ncbi:type III pantothenate kinase [Mucilaginibacter boryungensis]|uniref:Type III pantothenate kinase n=1 Tax=Mucilaginibacter boryungensis TaxID=768480 RepID=A0ABR9XL37_9SPHI|nr:type III pantothenate kinase [Mucilaginibacter boryungensis]MBE9667927.1 type III pantothenate kinase [Mucilaginibacter boryungensis]
MANLVIDIGNSYTKAAVFNNNELLKIEHYKTIDIPQLSGLTDGYTINQTIISSVKKEKDSWEEELKANMPLVYFTREMATQITNHYRTPQTLGIDRLAAVMGAHCLYPDKDNLVIDAGTCITYDYVDAGGNYYGGSISPGLQMRFKAMHNYTAALPLVNADSNFGQMFGADTESAILSGVQNGLKYELTGFIENYRNGKPQLNILLTGGDGIFFDTLLKNSIFAPYIKNEPYLVLQGLNAAIQQHND